MAEDRNWQDHDEIALWAEEWREDAAHSHLSFRGHPDPTEELRARGKRGHYLGADATSVAAYVAQIDAAKYRLSDAGKADRDERAVLANELAASAASRSARWAGWAIVISLVALALSAWPYVREALHGKH